MEKYIDQLNHPQKSKRIEALKELHQLYLSGKLQKQPVDYEFVNNHIHTTYSFSPYSPAKALWIAFISGLSTAGIMDHDSVGGALEFIEAGEVLKMATTVGMECRVDMSGTSLAGRRINNPDQSSVAYMALHGIPHSQLERVAQFIKPYQQERNKRNRRMIGSINKLVENYGIVLDYDKDVLPLSMEHEGGSVTERHLLYALSLMLIEACGKGSALVQFLEEKLKIHPDGKVRQFLLDFENPYYAYDLLGVLKSEMVEKFYIPASAECPMVSEVIALCKETGAIPAYAYLGDVGVSVTGDKKSQKFEDDFLDLLFEEIKRLGFRAVTYMPSRNTRVQLDRVKKLCDQYGLFQISGEDINSPRQKFICEAMRDSAFSNLTEATWALIGHERAASENLDKAMFSKASDKIFLNLEERIQYYKIKEK